jgi:hypothetical protein
VELSVHILSYDCLSWPERPFLMGVATENGYS